MLPTLHSAGNEIAGEVKHRKGGSFRGSAQRRSKQLRNESGRSENVRRVREIRSVQLRSHQSAGIRTRALEVLCNEKGHGELQSMGAEGIGHLAPGQGSHSDL